MNGEAAFNEWNVVKKQKPFMYILSTSQTHNCKPAIQNYHLFETDKINSKILKKSENRETNMKKLFSTPLSIPKPHKKVSLKVMESILQKVAKHKWLPSL